MVVYIDKSQFDNFISIHTKQLVLGLTAFFLPKFQIGVFSDNPAYLALLQSEYNTKGN